MNCFAAISFVGVSIFGITSIIVHFLRNDLSFIQNTLSRYAVGKNGWILIIGLYCMAIAEIILSADLIKNEGLSIGSILLGIAGIGVLLVAIFKMDITESKTLQGLFHVLGAIIEFLLFPIALLFLAHEFTNKDLIIASNLMGILTGTFFLILSYFFFLKMIKKKKYKVFGLLEKLNILFITVWMIYTAYVLM